MSQMKREALQWLLNVSQKREIARSDTYLNLETKNAGLMRPALLKSVQR